METLDAEQIKQIIENGKLDKEPGEDVVVNIQSKPEEPVNQVTIDKLNQEPKPEATKTDETVDHPDNQEPK